MKKSAVLYIALGRYVSFWKGFYVCGAFNGGVRWLRGQSERKIPNNWFIRNVMIPGCKVVSVFIPSKKYRNKVKNHFGSIKKNRQLTGFSSGSIRLCTAKPR